MKRFNFFASTLCVGYVGIVTSVLFFANCGGTASQSSVSNASQVQTKPETVPAASAAPPAVQQDQLDLALREASAYISSTIQVGAKLAVVAITSNYPTLSEYIVDGVMENLVNERKFTVVDRQQLDAIRTELKFQTSGEVDDNTVQGIGRMTGAQSIVLGSVSPIGSGNMWRISIRALTVQNAVVLGLFNKNIPNAGIIKEYGLSPKPAPAAGVNKAPASQQAAAPQTAAPAVSQTPPATPPISNGSASGGQKYTVKVVTIGNQTWMAENLNTKTGNSWCYEGDDYNCKKYGRLYDWNTAKSACPSGWHLPVKAEWEELRENIGGDRAGAGTKLKSKIGWSNNGNGTDEYGFSALPGGSRGGSYLDAGSFSNAGKYGNWWTATELGDCCAYARGMGYNHQDVTESENKNKFYNEVWNNKQQGLSVRCVRD